MKNEYIEKIKKACINTNPDILKLTAGCRFWVWAGDRKSKLDCFMINDTHYALSKYTTKNQYIWEINEKEIKDSGGEIIGRTICLADIVYTLDFIYKGIVPEISTIWELTCKWNCLKDNLSDQSEETLKFISNLLN